MATKTLNIALDESLIVDIDKAVKKDFGSRSEYFRRLALQDLQRRREWDKLFNTANAKGYKQGIVSEKQVYDMIDEYKVERQQ